MSDLEKPKTILLVDNDEILRDGMRQILRAEGYEIREASNGEEAVRLIETSGSFDLVISDAKMPILDGLQLLKFVKLNKKSRFLLIAENSDFLQASHAKQLGADEFLNKPFTRTNFILSVEASFMTSEISAKASNAADFIQVPMSEFVTGTILKVDLYLKLTPSKFVKIGSRGSALSSERMQGYLDKGIKNVHMRKEDYALYVGFNMALSKMAHPEASIEFTRKLRLTKHITETLITQLCESGLDREQLEDASNVIMNTVELVGQSAEALRLLETMEFVGTLPEHSIAVGIWSCLIAKKVGWTGQQTFFKIALCALFHDIGQKELDDKILSKPRFDMSQSELRTFESHTIRGREILQSVLAMPEDIAIVALQHHELMHGGGYPYNIKLDQIHPMARLIGVADQLCEILRLSTNGKDTNLKYAYELLARKRRDFDPSFLKALEEMIKEIRGLNAA